ncbi:ABC transporter ATP-binding protein [Lutispora thermophila]|uniref:ATP-binding cassette, subfamily B n=1 Tax=Lutispora thermophila DSM 19022 TaxID=1122184 RepID=A0A1M6E3X9_9FIRM|nr:ABC transporter ATP-binding protein [Lutispora thermophila]SHI80089.1 ATP-binding cassette, subfamily B [Lutispora thermophila DSM 19022]
MGKFKHIEDFFKKYKWKYILGIFVLLFVDGLQLITPKILGYVTDALSAHTLSMKEIFFYAFLIVLIAVFIAIFRYLWRMLIIGSSRQLEFWLRNKLFSHLEKLSLNYFYHNKTGDLMAHATNDINAVRMAFGMGVVMMTDAIFLTASTIIIMMVSIDIKFTLIALIPFPFVALIVTFFGKLIQKRFKRVQETFSSLTDKAQESFSGIRVIKSFVQEESEINNFAKANEINLQANMNLVKVWGAMSPLVIFLPTLSFVITLYYGGTLVIDKVISLGQLVSFISYLELLTWPMMAIGHVINVLQRGIASMTRINEILDTEPEIHDDDNTLDIDNFEESIEFRNLSFTYPGAKVPALSDINIKLEKGKTLAVIGKTGSGKSTLANLLLRLYNVEEGSILLGGYDINKIPIDLLRRKIGYVPQDNFLFSCSIRDNIAFADENMPFEKIEEAAKITSVHDDIIGFPNKFDTQLGERGVTLSGGQKQRVSIARAIAKNPGIMIFDDCLSAVDTKTEEKMLSNLKEVTKDRTSIIIAHRISTVKHADEIIVLDEGRIIERGTHDELVALGGYYSSIYHKQLLEEKIAGQE